MVVVRPKRREKAKKNYKEPSDVAGLTLEFLKGPRRGQKRLVDESPYPPPTFRPECEISYVHVEERDVMRHRDEARA